MRHTVMVDFDGTITDRDTLELVVGEFGEPEVRRVTERALGSSLGLHDVIAAQYSTVRAPLAAVVDWLLDEATVRPGFAELVDFVCGQGWGLTVVSSGLRELIGPVLAREGFADLELVANSVDPSAAGWRVLFRSDSRCSRCGEACKRSAIDALGSDRLVYIGDGYSDGCAAEAADLVFARRRLASYLEERGLAFVPFDDFVQVVDRLQLKTRDCPA